jgi:hypothetical protein
MTLTGGGVDGGSGGGSPRRFKRTDWKCLDGSGLHPQAQAAKCGRFVSRFGNPCGGRVARR